MKILGIVLGLGLFMAPTFAEAARIQGPLAKKIIAQLKAERSDDLFARDINCTREIGPADAPVVTCLMDIHDQEIITVAEFKGPLALAFWEKVPGKAKRKGFASTKYAKWMDCAMGTYCVISEQ